MELFRMRLHPTMSIVGLLYGLLACSAPAESADTYTEHLRIRAMHNRFVHTQFRFTTLADHSSLKHGRYDLFPRRIGEILNKYNIQELDLSLTQGTWRYGSWGFPVTDSTRAAGAEVHAIFRPGTTDVDQAWLGLVNTLSGLVCASLNFMDSSIAVQPSMAFRPRGVVNNSTSFNESLVRYSILPYENVCTENLTPWKKLLPCSFSKEGLSSLLTARKLYDTLYHSLSLSVRPICADVTCSQPTLQLTQSLSAVFEPSVNSGRPETWSLQTLFGAKISKKCDLAASSSVSIEYPSGDGQLSLDAEPEPETRELVDERLQRLTYAVRDGLDISVKYRERAVYTSGTAPALSTHRFIAGYGQEKGTLLCHIHNNLDEFISIIYTDPLPWFLRVFMHTLTITSDGNKLTPQKLAFSPGNGTPKQRKSHLLEMLVTLPPNSTTVISLEFERLFLRWTEYPPDANLGFYVPSSVITALLPAADADHCMQVRRDGTGVARMYTEKLLVSLPTPDFSMPYNVICLACTIVALAFGSIHNLTVKTYGRKGENDQGLVSRVMVKVKRALGMKAPVAEPSKEITESGDNSSPNDDATHTDADDLSHIETDDENPTAAEDGEEANSDTEDKKRI